MRASRYPPLERFSNTYVLTDSIEGGFFLRKKPLCGVVSVYSNWRTAIVRIDYFSMTWTLGDGSDCAAQTIFVALITAQLAAPSAPLAIRKVPVPGAVVSQA